MGLSSGRKNLGKNPAGGGRHGFGKSMGLWDSARPSERGKELSKKVGKFAKSDFPTLPTLNGIRIGDVRLNETEKSR